MITIFLGAGFSFLAGVPLASQIFDEEPRVDRITRQKLVQRVVEAWRVWHTKHGGAPEEYLSFLQQSHSSDWFEAVWFVALRIALAMGRVQYVGNRPAIVQHNINRTTRIPAQEEFWATIFRQTHDVSVITTNYDILGERGLRIGPRPRKRLPGFHYGNGAEQLGGGGYPSFAHIVKIACSGKVPVYKLHGSVSWSFNRGQLVKYHDCRPAIRGDAAIIAPVKNKEIPTGFQAIWQKAAEALKQSSSVIIVGYSLPEYDLAVRELLRHNITPAAALHIFDPQSAVAERYRALLPENPVFSHSGLPNAIPDLRHLLKSYPTTR